MIIRCSFNYEYPQDNLFPKVQGVVRNCDVGELNLTTLL